MSAWEDRFDKPEMTQYITIKKEVVEQALEPVYDQYHPTVSDSYKEGWRDALDYAEQAIDNALNSTLEQPTESEPFGYWHVGETVDESEFFLWEDVPDSDKTCESCIPLFTHPAPAVPENVEPVEWMKQRIAELETWCNDLEAEVKDYAYRLEQHTTSAAPSFDAEKWQLVPKEPTPKMKNVGWGSNVFGRTNKYKAMLAAAPQPEK